MEEAHTELDIRMHLHEPRLGRVDDIGHTREGCLECLIYSLHPSPPPPHPSSFPFPLVAELTVHRDRILRHTNGVISAIDESKSLVESLSAKQDKLVYVCVCVGGGGVVCVYVCFNI